MRHRHAKCGAREEPQAGHMAVPVPFFSRSSTVRYHFATQVFTASKDIILKINLEMSGESATVSAPSRSTHMPHTRVMNAPNPVLFPLACRRALLPPNAPPGFM